VDYKAVKRRLLFDILGPAAKRAGELGDASSAQQFAKISAEFAKAKFPVMVCGEFKRGKSSLVGALLADDGLCPVDVDVATNTVTSIEYGTPERIEVQSRDGRVPIERADLASYVTEPGNPGNARGAEMVLVQTPNERVRGGLVLLDTPGIGGVHATHSAVTYGLLPYVAAAIFVADVVEPLSASELQFVERALAHAHRAIVVLTRADLVADPTPVVEDTRRKLAPLLGKEPSAVEVVAVSNFAYFDYLKTGDSADLDVSGFAALEAALQSLEDDRPRMLVERTAAQARGVLERMRAPLLTERAACADQSKAATEHIEAELAAGEARNERLSRESAGWRRMLARLLDDARLDVSGLLQREWVRLDNAFRAEYLNDEGLLKDPERVGQLLARDVALVQGRVNEALESAVARICDEVAVASEVQLDGGAFEGIAATEDLPGSRAGTERSRFDLGMTIGRHAMFGFGLANAVGAPIAMLSGASTVSALALGPIGIVLMLGGLAVGVASGMGQVAKEDRAARQKAVAERFAPFLADLHHKANTSLARAAKRIGDSLSDAFDAQLQAERDALAASRRALGDARGKNRVQATARVAELDRVLTELDALDVALRDVFSAEAGAFAPAALPDEAWADA
jgi:hypothetical protein